MKIKTSICKLFSILVCILCISPFALAQMAEHKSKAMQILDATNVKGGLVVHLGCGDGKLTAALRANDSYLVHGLDKDARNIRKARYYVSGQGLYGEVSVEQWSGRILPYNDNVVNLLVADDLGDVPIHEVMRVLCPNGVAYVKGKKTVKPRPSDIDEWTHFLHDSDGNAVAKDKRVAT
ncbi:MAG: class I SAM-dependent methyltransferase, partial [Planctomycetota bacterium]